MSILQGPHQRYNGREKRVKIRKRRKKTPPKIQLWCTKIVLASH